jgi:hypothetical protein
MSVYLLAVVWETAEDQGQVQRVGAGGQRFVEHPVAADALDADAVPVQVPGEVAPADGRAVPKAVFAAIRTCRLGVRGQVARRSSSQARSAR